jgi:hypothetical protein
MTAGADVFAASAGGAKAMAQQFGVPYLGHIPLDPNLLKACEEGRYVTLQLQVLQLQVLLLLLLCN